MPIAQHVCDQHVPTPLPTRTATPTAVPPATPMPTATEVPTPETLLVPPLVITATPTPEAMTPVEEEETPPDMTIFDQTPTAPPAQIP